MKTIWPVTRKPVMSLLLLTPLLIACMSGCDNQQVLDDGQVLARVNGDDITIHQFNFAVSQSGSKALSPTDRAALVEKMIDRQLAVQKALEMKIDRQPEVLMRLEEARQDILAAAYAYRIGAANPPPTRQAITAYYSGHPGLFAKRKIYRIREITLPTDAPLLVDLKSRLQGEEEFSEVVSWLHSQTSDFGDQQTVRAAEQLPTEIADKLCEIAPGATVSFETSQAFIIYHLLSFEESPVDEKTAEGAIQNYLRKQGEISLYKKELERLRSAAEIVVRDRKND